MVIAVTDRLAPPVDNDQLRVFYVDPVGGHRGMHYYDFELCQALRAIDVDVTLLTCDETRTVAFPASLPIEFPFEGIYGSASKLIRGLRYLRGLIRIGLSMRRRDIPLAHFHYCHVPPLDYLYLNWLRLLGKRLVLTVHDVVPFDANASDLVWIRRIYHSVDRLIVHTLDSHRAIRERFGVGEDSVRIISHGPFFGFSGANIQRAREAKQRLGYAIDTPIILFFGQIKTVKGLQYLIRSFRLVADQRPDVRLVIAGPEWNEKFDAYATLIEELNLADRVCTRIEYVPDEEVGFYFSGADLVVLPYTESYQSGVLYMAYSFGKPVVASAVGGLAEVVRDGETGLLVPPADVEGLADGLLKLLGDPDMARVMGEQGRALAQTAYGWPEIARKTAAVYAEVLRAGGAV